MRTCPSRDTLSDLLDIAVPPTRGVATRRRLRRCDVCAWIFADEESLRIAARTYGAADSAPPRLRGAVLAALPLAPIPVSAPRCKWVMGTLAGATVASLAAFSVLAVLFRPAIRRLPAYAEVETSMRQIRTARWEVHFTVFTTEHARTRRFTARMAARMSPPALRTEYPGGTVHLLEPADLTVHSYPRYTVFEGPAGSGFFSVDSPPIPSPSQVV